MGYLFLGPLFSVLIVQFDKMSSNAVSARRGTIKNELTAGLQSGKL